MANVSPACRQAMSSNGKQDVTLTTSSLILAGVFMQTSDSIAALPLPAVSSNRCSVIRMTSRTCQIFPACMSSCKSSQGSLLQVNSITFPDYAEEGPLRNPQLRTHRDNLTRHASRCVEDLYIGWIWAIWC